MENKNFTIIEDIFDDGPISSPMMTGLNDDYNNSELNSIRKNMIRTPDSHSARPPYPVSEIGNMPSLSYDEDMIRNKLSRQVNPKVIANSQYNSMTGSNRILQPSVSQNGKGPVPVPVDALPNRASLNTNGPVQSFNDGFTCKNIYDHIENCPICNKYYKQSNRIYVLIIIFLVLIILLLLRQKN